MGVSRTHSCIDFDGGFDDFPPEIHAVQQAGYKIHTVNRNMRKYIDLRKYSASKALGWQPTKDAYLGMTEQNTLGPAQYVWQTLGRNVQTDSMLGRLEVTYYVTTRGTTYRSTSSVAGAPVC